MFGIHEYITILIKFEYFMGALGVSSIQQNRCFYIVLLLIYSEKCLYI
jgi:hypothetical protein